MSLLDELLYGRAIIKGADTYIEPDSIGNEEVADETIPVGDIADAAVTADKIAAAAVGNGLTGGGGTTIKVDPAASCNIDGANHLEVNAEGVQYAHMNADTIGTGLVDGTTGFDVDYDDVTLNVDGSSDLQIKDAGLGKDNLLSTAKQHTLSVTLPTFTATPGTVIAPLLVVPTGISIAIIAVEIASYDKPNDADGTVTFRVRNYDVSAAADDEIVAAYNTEGLTAKLAHSLTVITAADINILEETDYLYAELACDSAAVDAQPTAFVCTIVYEEV